MAVLGNARFAHAMNLSTASGHDDGGIGMGFQEPLDRIPAAIVPLALEGVFDKAQEVISQNGDKDMGFDAGFELMVVRP